MSTPQYLRSIKLTIGDNTEALDLFGLRQHGEQRQQHRDSLFHAFPYAFRLME